MARSRGSRPRESAAPSTLARARRKTAGVGAVRLEDAHGSNVLTTILKFFPRREHEVFTTRAGRAGPRPPLFGSASPARRDGQQRVEPPRSGLPSREVGRYAAPSYAAARRGMPWRKKNRRERVKSRSPPAAAHVRARARAARLRVDDGFAGRSRAAARGRAYASSAYEPHTRPQVVGVGTHTEAAFPERSRDNAVNVFLNTAEPPRAHPEGSSSRVVRASICPVEVVRTNHDPRGISTACAGSRAGKCALLGVAFQARAREPPSTIAGRVLKKSPRRRGCRTGTRRAVHGCRNASPRLPPRRVFSSSAPNAGAMQNPGDRRPRSRKTRHAPLVPRRRVVETDERRRYDARDLAYGTPPHLTSCGSRPPAPRRPATREQQ